jgi:hypothetical protein
MRVAQWVSLSLALTLMTGLSDLSIDLSSLLDAFGPGAGSMQLCHTLSGAAQLRVLRISYQPACDRLPLLLDRLMRPFATGTGRLEALHLMSSAIGTSEAAIDWVPAERALLTLTILVAAPPTIFTLETWSLLISSENSLTSLDLLFSHPTALTRDLVTLLGHVAPRIVHLGLRRSGLNFPYPCTLDLCAHPLPRLRSLLCDIPFSSLFLLRIGPSIETLVLRHVTPHRCQSWPSASPPRDARVSGSSPAQPRARTTFRP